MKKKKKEASVFKKKQAYVRYKQFLKLAKRVAIGVFIASFLWISIDGYHRLISRELVEESSYLTQPLAPQMKVEALEKIRAKEYFSVEAVDNYFKTLKVALELPEELGSEEEASLSEEVKLAEGEESSPSGENEKEEEITKE